MQTKPQGNITHIYQNKFSKRQQIAGVGEDVEKKEPLHIVGGNTN